MPKTILQILIHPSIDGPEFDALREKGHTIHRMDFVQTEHEDARCVDVSRYDLILGPNAFRMTPDLLTLLNVTLTNARRQKREESR